MTMCNFPLQLFHAILQKQQEDHGSCRNYSLVSRLYCSKTEILSVPKFECIFSTVAEHCCS